ncbi:hypothetical protein DFO80_12015 [Rhodobacter sp. 140A]|nr:hypothetical protein DFO80_12015 [Rhodobacter sp. 140A]
MASFNTTTSNKATMTARDAFFDKLETYFDFRNAKPENFNPIALRNLARDLVQMCDAVRNISDRIAAVEHRARISQIAVEEGFLASVKEWGRGGYMLNEGARLVAFVLNSKFNFDLGEAA